MTKFDKKYRAVSVESERFNPLHDMVRDSVCCYPAYFKVGERGWFLLVEDTGSEYITHKAHITPIQDVVYEENRITVQTVNTKYAFEVIGEE